MTAALTSVEEVPPNELLLPQPAYTGVLWERVDPYTLRVIDMLFPGHHGTKFLAGLLRLAEAKQLALPELGLSEIADVAVITVQSLRTLAKQLGLSYDTTEKYIVLFSTLCLIYKKRYRRQVVLHFPLCRCRLPDPEVLDQLQEMRVSQERCKYRPKVRTFAQQVKARLLQLWQTQSVVATAHSTAEADDFVYAWLDDICRIVNQEVDSETASRLLPKIKHATHTHYRCLLQSRLSTSQDDFDSSQDTSDGQRKDLEKGNSSATVVDAYKKESSSLNLKDDFDHLPSQQQSRQTRTENDSLHTNTITPSNEDIQQSPSAQQKGDSLHRSLRTESPVVEPKVDSQNHSTHQSRPLALKTPQKGDSDVSQNNDVATNVNVITIIKDLTLNVSKVALFCCAAFHETFQKQGIYSKLFQEIDHDTEAITAAFLYTIVRRRDGTMRKPAAVFIQRCRDYHSKGIPADAALLVEQYGFLSYTQLQQALAAPVTPAAMPPDSSCSFGSSAPANAANPRPGRPAPTNILKIKGAVRTSGGMSLEDAQRLYATIARDQRIALFRSTLVALPDSTYAVLIDNRCETAPRQVVMYSEQEWLERSRDLPHLFRSKQESARLSPRELWAQKLQSKKEQVHHG